MDYEKLHKDTIVKLQEMVNSGKITVETARGICADFVPEGEDERIKKELLKHLKEGADGYEPAGGSEDYKRWLDWFEKQMGANGNDEEIPNSKQKSTWGKEDDYAIERLFCLLDNEQDNYPQQSCSFQEIQEIKERIKSLRERVLPQPKQKWSEEDEEMLDTVIEDIIRLAGPKVCYHKDVEWLKSLKDRYTWKPSELQIEALAIAIRCGIKLGTWEEEALKDLIEQLKKLREE